MLMQTFQLNEFENVKAKFLSGGNQRKLCSAIALLSSPQIILMDEPSNGYDPLSRKNLYQYLRSLRGKIIIIAT